MSTVIKLKRSETASTPPSAGDLQTGEVAINSTDKKIFVKESGGSVVELANSLNLFEELQDVDVSSATSTVNMRLISDGDGTYSFKNDTVTALSDVTNTGSLGQVLKKIGASTYAFSTHRNLDLLTITTAAAGAPSLSFNGTTTLTYTPPNFAGLDDTNFSLLATGMHIEWDGTDWINVSNPLDNIAVTTNAAGAPSLTYAAGAFTYTPPNFAGLDDTNFTSLAVGDHLEWDGTDWINVDKPLAGLTVTTNAAGSPALAFDGTSVFTYTPPNFEGLSDVDTSTSTSTADMRMKSDGDATYSFVADTIDNLNNVTISGLANGQVLATDGTSWSNETINFIKDLTVTTAAAGSPSLSFDGVVTLTYTPPNFEGLSDVDVSTATSTANMRLRSDGDGTYSFVSDTLGALTDVNYGGALSAGDFLVFSGSSWVRTIIRQLSDLSITTAAAGNPSLSFNGTDTLTYTPPNLNGISDVTLTTPTAGDALVYDGTGWINESGNGAPTTTNDVTLGEVQKYDTGAETWSVEDMYGASSQRIKREVSGSDIIYTFA